jgi:hypothetical protein
MPMLPNLQPVLVHLQPQVSPIMEDQITDYKVGTAADEFKFGGLWPVSPHQFFDGKFFRIKSPTRIENASATPTKCVSEASDCSDL